jgi:hypothetical protein
MRVENQRQPRIRDEAHLARIRRLPCMMCGQAAEAAHVRLSCAEVGKINPGVGQKPDDRWAAPLCHKHHMQQHDMGDEEGFWIEVVGINVIALCLDLYGARDDEEEMLRIVKLYRSRAKR